MSAKNKPKSGVARVNLSGEQTIYGAPRLKAQLLDALSTSAEIEVNLSRVTEIDTAAVQLLVLAKREAQAAGKNLRLVAHSAASTEALDLLQLGGYFGDPIVLTARS
jgi:anti-sigma B factor antagonist